MTLELYKGIPNYEEIYQVSNLGKVRNITTGKILKPFLNKYGYLQVTLCKNGKTKLFRVHRLVAECFIENPFKKEQVNHINGNKIDNRIDNLEWCTGSENVKHSYKNKLQVAKRGKNNKLSKRVIQYDLEGNLIKEWDSVGEVFRELNIKKQYISACCLRKIKHTRGYIFRYEEGLN